jgi:hypothetical protein
MAYQPTPSRVAEGFWEGAAGFRESSAGLCEWWLSTAVRRKALSAKPAKRPSNAIYVESKDCKVCESEIYRFAGSGGRATSCAQKGFA